MAGFDNGSVVTSGLTADGPDSDEHGGRLNCKHPDEIERLGTTPLA